MAEYTAAVYDTELVIVNTIGRPDPFQPEEKSTYMGEIVVDGDALRHTVILSTTGIWKWQHLRSSYH